MSCLRGRACGRTSAAHRRKGRAAFGWSVFFFNLQLSGLIASVMKSKKTSEPSLHLCALQWIRLFLNKNDGNVVDFWSF